MDNRFQGLLAIHLAVLLFGVAGLFGKLLELGPGLIVFGRTLFAALGLLLVLPLLKIDIRIRQGRDIGGFVLMGAILALHWVTFFHAIQVSTVAIGLLTFSSFPIFVTFLEPLFFRERLRFFEVMVSLVVFLGLVLVVPEFDLANDLTRGAFWGMISGLTFALLSILNRKFVGRYPALTVALYQDAVACLLLLPFVGGAIFGITMAELGQLVILGVVFTALAHTLFIQGMLVVRAQLASVITCLEPVYGILLALVLLHEIPSWRELVGGVVIIGTILLATRFSRDSGRLVEPGCSPEG
ncbi:DMT family transporter [Desulfogranum mediterraneum]|uniref:DMT family transporter n=1 Tax=Desulfogranum mediterraneum TaxID=160661 RepID=UPI000491B0E9|nr:DMT family transporter [Desulfogranum mediterraneum]